MGDRPEAVPIGCIVAIPVKWPRADVPGFAAHSKMVRHPPTDVVQAMDAGAFRPARIPIRPLAVAATDQGAVGARNWPPASGGARRQPCTWAVGRDAPKRRHAQPDHTHFRRSLPISDEWPKGSLNDNLLKALQINCWFGRSVADQAHSAAHRRSRRRTTGCWRRNWPPASGCAARRPCTWAAGGRRSEAAARGARRVARWPVVGHRGGSTGAGAGPASARFAVTRDGQRFAIMSRGASDYSAISVMLGWSPQSAAAGWRFTFRCSPVPDVASIQV
jgi:hypothetical protein